MCGTFAPDSDTPQCHIQQYTQCIHVLGVISRNTLLNNATYFSLLSFELALDTLLCYTVPKLEYALWRLTPGTPMQIPCPPEYW